MRQKDISIPSTTLIPATKLRPAIGARRPPAARPGWGLLEVLVIAQSAIPATLLLPGVQAMRPVVRSLAYLVGYSGLLVPRARKIDRRLRHPSLGWAILIVVYLAGALLLSRDRIQPAGAQFVLICSVLAPVFWAARCVHDARQLHRLLWLILITSGLNSLVGVLQVYDPDRWMPLEMSRRISDMNLYRYVGSDERVILRPCGLYDTPGAVCAPGAWAAIVGFALFQFERSYYRKAFAIACAFLGAAVIYLTLVRTAFIVVLVGAATYASLLLLRNQSSRAVSYALIVATTLAGSLVFAEIFGGATVVDRFQTLFSSEPTNLYYQSRGIQLEHALLVEATQNPLGVGLGSWGTIPATFGGGFRFAELQVHGWLLDGGVPLLLLYSIAVLVAVYNDVRVCLTTRSALIFSSASCIAAINVSTVVTVISFVPFNTPVGMQFWLLTGALHGAAVIDRTVARSIRDRPPGGRRGSATDALGESASRRGTV